MDYPVIETEESDGRYHTKRVQTELKLFNFEETGNLYAKTEPVPLEEQPGNYTRKVTGYPLNDKLFVVECNCAYPQGLDYVSKTGKAYRDGLEAQPIPVGLCQNCGYSPWIIIPRDVAATNRKFDVVKQGANIFALLIDGEPAKVKFTQELINDAQSLNSLDIKTELYNLILKELEDYRLNEIEIKTLGDLVARIMDGKVDREITPALVKACREWLGKMGIDYFRKIRETHGEIAAVFMESGSMFPHAVHFSEGMQIRNFMRDNGCADWSADDLDNNWDKLIERCIA